jgi:hypothetical protein
MGYCSKQSNKSGSKLSRQNGQAKLHKQNSTINVDKMTLPINDKLLSPAEQPQAPLPGLVSYGAFSLPLLDGGADIAEPLVRLLHFCLVQSTSLAGCDPPSVLPSGVSRLLSPSLLPLVHK